MYVSCLDLEGVLVPEIWVNVAEHTGIDELRVTTRDISDYDELMRHRLSVIDKSGLRLFDIQKAIDSMTPLQGADTFLGWLRERSQVIILSDTFYEFAAPLMRQLQWPTLFCHHLLIDRDGRVEGYRLRQPDQKREVVRALHELHFRVIAVGDSYNDTDMLEQADYGIFFRPPDNVVRLFPQYPVTTEFEELRLAFEAASSEMSAE